MIQNKSGNCRISQVSGIDAHQAQDFEGLCGEDHERLLDRLDEQDEFSEVAIVSSMGFDFLPEILDRIVVW